MREQHHHQHQHQNRACCSQSVRPRHTTYLLHTSLSLSTPPFSHHSLLISSLFHTPSLSLQVSSLSAQILPSPPLSLLFSSPFLPPFHNLTHFATFHFTSSYPLHFNFPHLTSFCYILPLHISLQLSTLQFSFPHLVSSLYSSPRLLSPHHILPS